MHRSARAAGDYVGAMAAGGRWNPIGIPMLYAARYLSLACVEVLVHLDKSELPRARLRLVNGKVAENSAVAAI